MKEKVPPASPASTLNAALSFAKKIPTPLAVLLGVIIGLGIGQIFKSEVSAVIAGIRMSTNEIPCQKTVVPEWGSHLKASRPRSSSRIHIPPPTVEQRERILHLLTNLSPHHTRYY